MQNSTDNEINADVAVNSDSGHSVPERKRPTRRRSTRRRRDTSGAKQLRAALLIVVVSLLTTLATVMPQIANALMHHYFGVPLQWKAQK